MNMNEAHQLWDQQMAPCRTREEVQQVIDKHAKAARRRAVSLLCFAGFGIVAGVFIFYGSLVHQHESLFLASLRCILILSVVPIQLYAWLTIRKQDRERESSGLSQRSYLEQIVRDLRQEAEYRGIRSMGLFALAVFGLSVLIKWLDFRQGGDSAAECVAILVFTAALLAVLMTAMWHRVRMFVVPQYHRNCELLRSMDSLPAEQLEKQ